MVKAPSPHAPRHRKVRAPLLIAADGTSRAVGAALAADEARAAAERRGAVLGKLWPPPWARFRIVRYHDDNERVYKVLRR